MKSITRQYRKLIKKDSIRKYVTKIYIDHDVDHLDNGELCDVIYIYFKEGKVLSTYEEEFMEMTDVEVREKGIEFTINEWLDEIAMTIEEYEENRKWQEKEFGETSLPTIEELLKRL